MAQQALFEDINPARHGDNRRRQPLILPEVLAHASIDPHFFDDEHLAAHKIITTWADLESSGKLQDMKETTLQGEFISDIFGKALGYTRFSANLDQWQVQEHYSLPRGQDTDAALGFFAKEGGKPPTAVIELKGPTVNVDRQKFAGRTPVQQCWGYMNELPQCPWGIVCNYVSFRLYHRNHTPQEYELFTLQELRDPKRFSQFLTLFQRGGLLGGIIGQVPRALQLLTASQERQKKVGRKLYDDYHLNRQALIAYLRKEHGQSVDAAIKIAQTLLDRIMFIAFCEDRELLPHKSIEKTWRNIGAFSLATNPRWGNFLNLFRSIDKGNQRFDIPPFNGGLFAHNTAVDDLELDDHWTDFFKTIGEYDFRFEVNVDVLGHVFEQSITDLEAIRRDPESIRQPAAKVSSKRKREGVYYTPSHITRYIVENTLGPCIRERFAEISGKFGVDPDQEPTPENLPAWTQCHEAMLDSLRRLRVCDPACGSGAFLIEAFNFLEGAYADVIGLLGQYANADEGPLMDDARRSILQENLYGVDLSSEGAEIARLALWLRSAEKGKTLANLSDNVRCGNSIVDDRGVDPKAFDWPGDFAKVFAEGGFDCIVSNPPYVKLQNFRKTHPEIAAFLAKRYRSAQTGNFDMYLPFIERGLELLKPDGRLGFIAPNVWLFNEYGQGLREVVREAKALERFVDFKSFQVFEDATTYTALQFFSRKAQPAIEVIDAPDGQPAAASEPFSVTYSALSSGVWALVPRNGRDLIARMRKAGIPLSKACDSIFQGLVTSADAVFHLVKLGPGRYYSAAISQIVELEDAIMRPLVSGEEATPFAEPSTDIHLLFPYLTTEADCRLLSPGEMSRTYKRAWHYLKKNEPLLRSRENGKMDQDGWYGYVYPKSLDKQGCSKLLVPRLLLHLFASLDLHGQFSPDNVDVGGVVPAKGWNLHFLLGLLNSHALDYVWRMTSKPFRGEYRSANKQFIAPLPIPNIKPKAQEPVANLARKLSLLHGQQLEAFAKVRRRFLVDLTPPALLESSPLPPSLPRKLAAFNDLPMPDALKELEKYAKRKFAPKERENWDAYLKAEASALAVINRKIDDLTSELNQQVYKLYGLGPDDISVIETPI